MDNSQKAVLYLSIPLVFGTATASLYSLLHAEFYVRETANWALQSTGQDIIDLVLVCPVLVIAAIMAHRGQRMGMLIWAGTNLYLLYSFVIYAFAVHFNELFLLYCINLGLAFYSLLYFIYWVIQVKPKLVAANHRLARFTAIFFILIFFAFYGLWLSAIIPDLNHPGVPRSLLDTGLMTNPVHVIDLSVFLPGIFITAVLLWKKKWISYIIAPMILTFFVLMNLTIGFLHALMLDQGMAGSAVLIYIMLGLSALSTVLIIGYSRSFFIKNEAITIPAN